MFDPENIDYDDMPLAINHEPQATNNITHSKNTASTPFPTSTNILPATVATPADAQTKNNSSDTIQKELKKNKKWGWHR